MARARQQIIFCPSTVAITVSETPQKLLSFAEKQVDFVNGKIDALSEISSLADSGEENGKLLSSSSPKSKKRKRPSSEGGSQSGIEPRNKPTLRFPELNKEDHLHYPTVLGQNDNSNQFVAGEDQMPSDVGATSPADDNEALNVSQFLSVRQQNKKGKRKGKKVRDDNPAVLGSMVPSVGIQSDPNGIIEGEYSNGEDAEMEEAGDDGELDINARNEEGCEQFPESLKFECNAFASDSCQNIYPTKLVIVLKKRSAMDSLSAIEKCFATLRDK